MVNSVSDKMPLVTVIIPNYNHAPYLRQRIDSVLTQTFQDIEVILLDDCSKDDSREIIKSYEADPRITIVFNEQNSGCVFRQWNKGLSMAKGKYIWIAESDDYSDPKFLETLVARLEGDPNIGLTFCDSFRVCNGESTTARERWYGGFSEHYNEDFKALGKEFVAEQMLFVNMIPNASAVLFRRSVAEAAGPADESFRLSGDWLFWIKLLQRSDLAYIATPLNYYRYHEQTARHANTGTGVTIEDAYRIASYVLANFSISRETFLDIRERLTCWYVEVIISGNEKIPKTRLKNIRRLASSINPNTFYRLWYRRLYLQWLWLGVRRRLLMIWKMRIAG